MAHQAGAYPGLRSMKRLGVLLLPPWIEVSPNAGLPPAETSPVPIYNTRVERGAMSVKCLAQEHNAVPRPVLKPGSFDLESSALTIRPGRC